MLEVIPHPDNSCGGGYRDWLDVMLLPECNGSCSWCVEQDGYHPEKRAGVGELINRIYQLGRRNVVLLGGEPFLYQNLLILVQELFQKNFNVYITTNGSRINTPIFKQVIPYIKGMNFSIHHYDLDKNWAITGITLDTFKLFTTIQFLKKMNTEVRFNCNLTKGNIDSSKELEKYVIFSKMMGADSVKFSELCHVDPNEFVSASDIDPRLTESLRLTEDPFIHGCSNKILIHSCNQTVQFKQSCGIVQRDIPNRPNHKNVSCHIKPVLYYDGHVYSGWKDKNWNGGNIDDRISKLQPVERFVGYRAGDRSSGGCSSGGCR